MRLHRNTHTHVSMHASAKRRREYPAPSWRRNSFPGNDQGCGRPAATRVQQARTLKNLRSPPKNAAASETSQRRA